MFERYNHRARRVIYFARSEAYRFSERKIDTEHILLALLREDPELMGRFLTAENTPSIREQIDMRTPPINESSKEGDIALSDGSKRVLAYADREARALRYGYIGPAHLLLGLLCECDGYAAQLLTERDVTADKLREMLKRTSNKRREWLPYAIRYWGVRALHTISVFMLVLLLVQVFGLAMERHFYHFDAVFYAVALPLALSALLGLTWLLELRGQISRNLAMRYLVVAPMAVLPALVLVIRAFLSPTPE